MQQAASPLRLYFIRQLILDTLAYGMICTTI